MRAASCSEPTDEAQHAPVDTQLDCTDSPAVGDWMFQSRYDVAVAVDTVVVFFTQRRIGHCRVRRSLCSCTHTHTRLTALCPELPGWASTRKVKPIWILLEQETVSGSGISWAICKSAPRSRQTTTQAPTTRFFTGRMADALSAAQPTASKHWRQKAQTERCRNGQRNKNAGNLATRRRLPNSNLPQHHFGTSQKHADGTNRLASYDFLLGFCSYLGSGWNGCRVISQRNCNPYSDTFCPIIVHAGRRDATRQFCRVASGRVVWNVYHRHNAGFVLRTTFYVCGSPSSPIY